MNLKIRYMKKARLSKYRRILGFLLIILFGSTLQAQVIRYIDSASTLSGPGGTSWATATNDIQATIFASNPGDQIWVKKGTYRPYSIDLPAPVVSFTMKQGVSMYGGFAGNETALSQRIPDLYPAVLRGNGGRVIYNNGSMITNITVLDGFTISNGSFNGSGAGMFNYLSSPTISNCIFRDNVSTLGSGGAVYSSLSSPVITDCTFLNNLVNSPQGSEGGALGISGGTPVVTNCTFSGNIASGSAGYGGAISHNFTSSFILSNCLFSANQSNGLNGVGGAIYSGSSVVSADVNNCMFINNRCTGFGGALYNTQGSGSSVANCHFTGNTARTYGGAISNYSSSITISQCVFTGNSTTPNNFNEAYGGAISNLSGGASVIRNCIFRSNWVRGGTSFGGAVFNLNANPSLVNCIFSGNTASYVTNGNASFGGAVCNSGSSPSIINCTFNSDSALGTFGRGGAIYNYSLSSPVLTNCILYGNFGTGSEIFNASGAAVVTYSNIQGGYTGTGNLNVNPLFFNTADPAGPDAVWGTADDGLRIYACSQTNNAGNNAAVPLYLTSDITGAPRIQQETVDIGAYEGGVLKTANWLGISDNWASATNWSNGQVPDACTDVIVNSGVPFMPLVSGSQTCYRLSANNGATVQLTSGAQLTIVGK